MKIKHELDYEVDWDEIADEFTEHDSEYQARAINNIGLQFKIWSQDKARTSTYIQLMEIADDLDDNGKWFINTLHDYIQEVNADDKN